MFVVPYLFYWFAATVKYARFTQQPLGYLSTSALAIEASKPTAQNKFLLSACLAYRYASSQNRIQSLCSLDCDFGFLNVNLS